MENEFGSSSPVRWLKPEQVKMYDSEGNEVPIPKCDICGFHKCEVIGRSATAWICMNGCNN
jgi:hypothetical protein